MLLTAYHRNTTDCILWYCISVI